jgi:tRNA nucleotidyltransferase (CCA-adding enzyme)
MSDYMFKLESHLSTDQFRVVGQMQAVAAAAGVNLFLTGGAMRDMLGGFPVRDLDFTVEGNALKLAKTITQKYGATIVSTDELRKCVEMRFPGSVRVELAMARTEKFPKSGGRPEILRSMRSPSP